MRVITLKNHINSAYLSNLKLYQDADLSCPQGVKNGRIAGSIFRYQGNFQLPGMSDDLGDLESTIIAVFIQTTIP